MTGTTKVELLQEYVRDGKDYTAEISELLGKIETSMITLMKQDRRG